MCLNFSTYQRINIFQDSYINKLLIILITFMSTYILVN